MIFKQARQVLDGKKRQTRRPVKPGEYAIMRGPDLMEWEQWRFDGKPARLNPEDPLHQKMMKASIIEVRDAKDRLKWKVGKDYAVQPGRGKKALGRTPPIKGIRRERLLEIKPADCIDEGIVAHLVLFDHEYYREGSEFAFSTSRSAFRHLWNSLYRKPYRWEHDPNVWVLVFEPVEDFDEFIMRETEAAIEGGIIDGNTGLPFEKV